MQTPPGIKQPAVAQPDDANRGHPVPEQPDDFTVGMTCNHALVATERLCEFAQNGNQSAIRAAWDCAVRLAETVQGIAQTPPTEAALDCLKSCARPEIWMPALWAQRKALNANYSAMAGKLELGKESPFNTSSGKAHLTTPLAVFLSPIIKGFHRIHSQIERRLDHPVETPPKKAANRDWLQALRKHVAKCDETGAPVEEALREYIKTMDNFKGPNCTDAFQSLFAETMQSLEGTIQEQQEAIHEQEKAKLNLPEPELSRKEREKMRRVAQERMTQIEQALSGGDAMPDWKKQFLVRSYYLHTLRPMQKSNAYNGWATVFVNYIYLNYDNPGQMQGLKEIFQTAERNGRRNVRPYLEDKISRTLDGILSENNPAKPIPAVKQSNKKGRKRGRKPFRNRRALKLAFC
jgi:hypothetical protein